MASASASSRFARHNELRRDVSASQPLSSSAVAPSSSQPAANSTPSVVSISSSDMSIPVIAVVAAVVLLIIFAVGGWRFRIYRNKRKAASSPGARWAQEEKAYGSDWHGMERPRSAVVLRAPAPPPAGSGAGWVPQIRTVNGLPVSGIAPPANNTNPLHRERSVQFKTPPNFHKPMRQSTFGPPFSTEADPITPPSNAYTPGVTSPNAYNRQNPEEQPMISTSKQHRAGSNKRATRYSWTFFSTSPDHSTFADGSKDSSVLPPSPSHAESFRTHSSKQSKITNATLARPAANKKLPRAMTVTALFVPTLADELEIKLRETVRLVEEYEDGWCLVHHIGVQGREEKLGVVPRHCLAEFYVPL